MGKAAASSRPWSYADARVCTELKLALFGDFKIQFLVLCFGMPGSCLASVLRYVDDTMWGSEEGERLSASLI